MTIDTPSVKTLLEDGPEDSQNQSGDIAVPGRLGSRVVIRWRRYSK